MIRSLEFLLLTPSCFSWEGTSAENGVNDWWCLLEETSRKIPIEWGLGSFQIVNLPCTWRMMHPNSTQAKVPALRSLPGLALVFLPLVVHLYSSPYPLINRYTKVNVSLSCMSHSSKLMESKVGQGHGNLWFSPSQAKIVGNLRTYSLQLAPGVGWEQWCGTETLTSGNWHHLQVDSVRTELNSRTSDGCLKDLHHTYGDQKCQKCSVLSSKGVTQKRDTGGEQ